MSNVTQMDLINADIEYHGQGMTNTDVTRSILNEWRNSKQVNDMIQAGMYYKVENTGIEDKSRDYRDENGNVIKNEYLSNVKTRTAQYRKSVNQKMNFALAKPFIISCDDKNYKKEWETFLNSKNRAVIFRTGKEAVNKGKGWSYVWINDKGELDIVDTQSETIYPDWTDIAHTDLDCLVRDYTMFEYTNPLNPKKVKKVEYWDKEIVEKYIDNGDTDIQLEPDSNGEYELNEGENIVKTHLKNADGSGQGWDRVPFICFKGNMDELPLLNECKADIDAYDMLKSKSIDSLIDDIDPTIVIKGISPEMGELVRARELIKNARIMSVDIGGDANVLKVNTDITGIERELDLLRKNMIDNTSSVDLTTIQFGTNPSGKAMRAFYSTLDEWANGYETQFREYMENLKYFFDKWLSWKGGFGTFEQLQDIKITFSLDRDLMIDETEIVENVVKLDGRISQETLDEMNPYVENHEKEQKRRDKEEKTMLKKQELYQFAQVQNEQDEEKEENEQEAEQTQENEEQE